MNNVNASDVLLFTLATGALGSGIDLITKNSLVSGGILVLTGIVLVYVYHKFGSPTN